MKRSRTRLWYVISPEYSSGSSYEPPEYGADVVEVRARSAREAIRLGVIVMLHQGMGWVSDDRGTRSPYAGLVAEPGPVNGKGWVWR